MKMETTMKILYYIKNSSKTLGVPFHFHMLKPILATTLVTFGISSKSFKTCKYSNTRKGALNSIFITNKNSDYRKRK